MSQNNFRIISFVFGIIPSSIYMPMIILVLFNAIGNISSGGGVLASYIFWLALGGFIGFAGMLILVITKHPPRLLTTLLLIPGILSSGFAMAIGAEKIIAKASDFLSNAMLFVLIFPISISIAYLWKNWFKKTGGIYV